MNQTILRKCSVTTAHVQTVAVMSSVALDSSDSLTFSFQSGNPSAVDNRLFFFFFFFFFFL